MTELRQRMIDAMVQRGFALRTQETCVRAIWRMAKHYRRDPANYTTQEVQAYLLNMVKDEKLSCSSMNQVACAAQFLFQTALGHAREHFHVPFAKVPARQPELLAGEEISRLFAVCSHPVRRRLLQTIYATGLRGYRRPAAKAARAATVMAATVADVHRVHRPLDAARAACGHQAHPALRSVGLGV